jgi:hypothetical protein
MKSVKIISFILTMLSLTSFIGWTFWVHEIQYALPTPVPANFVDVKIGDNVDLKQDLKTGGNKITLLHFFNPECPCSRFNMQEFESMARSHKNDVAFYVVLQSEDEDAVERFQNKYDLNIPVILDEDGTISDKCGIYATPQAVLLDKNSTVYFKGNYNSSRYCTRKETKFVEIAIDSLIRNKPLPLFVQNMVTEPYGCTLPSDEVGQKEIAFNLF